MIEEIFKQLDLSTTEVKTYLLLLETGPIPASQLAKKLNQPRSSLYGFIKRLQEKGLVAESLKLGIKVFSAEPPEKISLLFQQRIEALERNQKTFQEILPELQKKQGDKYINPKLQLFEGEDGVKNLLKDVLLYSDLETLTFWPIKSMLEVLTPDFLRYHNKVRIKNNLSIRAIWPPSQVVDIKKYPFLGVGVKFKREIRIAPKEVDFSLGYWIYSNRCAFISSRKEGFGFIVESLELAEMLTTQFEVLWKISKPVKTDEKDLTSFLEELE